MPKRTRVIAITLGEGGDPDINFIKKAIDWPTIESYLGRRIHGRTRASLLMTVYFGQLLMERRHSELPAPEVAKRVHFIMRRLSEPRQMEKIIDCINMEADGQSEKAVRASRLLQHAVYLIDQKLGGSGELFSAIAKKNFDRARSTCEKVLKDLESGRRPAIGSAWRQWILEVARRAKKLVPAHARNDETSASPFVYLISELQKALPQAHRRSVQSPGALSKEISRTLRLQARAAKT